MGADADGRLRVLVEGTQLECQWSLRGERTASGAVSFRLELPPSPLSQVTVETPLGVELLVDRGILTRHDDAERKLCRWTIEAGGNHRLTLRVLPEEALRERRPLTLARQAMTYEFSSPAST